MKRLGGRSPGDRSFIRTVRREYEKCRAFGSTRYKVTYKDALMSTYIERLAEAMRYESQSDLIERITDAYRDGCKKMTLADAEAWLVDEWRVEQLNEGNEAPYDIVSLALIMLSDEK